MVVSVTDFVKHQNMFNVWSSVAPTNARLWSVSASDRKLASCSTVRHWAFLRQSFKTALKEFVHQLLFGGRHQHYELGTREW